MEAERGIGGGAAAGPARETATAPPFPLWLQVVDAGCGVRAGRTPGLPQLRRFNSSCSSGGCSEARPLRTQGSDAARALEGRGLRRALFPSLALTEGVWVPWGRDLHISA